MIRCDTLWSLTAICVSAAAGCSGEPPRVPAPDFKPGVIASAAMKRYDKDEDGKISGAELSPGLKAMLQTADKDEDKALSEREIRERMAVYVENRLGVMNLSGQLTMRGKPLVGVNVKLVPDPILAGLIQPASAVSQEDGFIELNREGGDPPGVQPGIYSVIASQKKGGRERLPARVNSKTEIGLEVGTDVVRGGWGLELSPR